MRHGSRSYRVKLRADGSDETNRLQRERTLQHLLVGGVCGSRYMYCLASVTRGDTEAA